MPCYAAPVSSTLNFERQQGFADAPAQGCELRFRALVWQPRIMLALIFAGWLLETGWYFVGLGLVLWWGAFVPRLNVFDLAYNALVARRRGLPAAPVAPAPRRFAMFLAGGLSISGGLAHLAGRPALGWMPIGVLVLAIAAIVFAKFCFGSYLYHVIRGQLAYAHRTMPWSRSE